MPRKKSTSQEALGKQGVKKAAGRDERLEDILLACRNHLRGRAPMTDKRDLLLTLVFLKFIGDRFLERRAAILSEHAHEPEFAEVAVKRESFYKQAGVFFLPEECLWSALLHSRSSGCLFIHGITL